MSLTTALSIAQNALLNTSRQTAVVSRNVSEASNPDYARRSAALVSAPGGARITEINRTTNDVLFRQNLSSLSAWQGQQTLYDGMGTLSLDVNGVDNANSAAVKLGELQSALQLYSAAPGNATTAENAIEAAREVVNALNGGARAIQSYRTDLDRQISSSVGDLNALLSGFEKANNEVVSGTAVGRDVNEALDQRDSLLKKIAEFVPVSTVTRSNNDLVIMTKDGATLFETVPRDVTFQPIAGYSAGAVGNGVMVDGVPIKVGAGGNTDASGKLSAMLQLRDKVAPEMQGQLDEIARGLITAFRETDSNGVQPDAAGLFTWPGGPAIPAGGTLSDGLAAGIRINAAFDSRAGGSAQLLRDGGANGADYVANPTGGAGYSELILQYAVRLDEPIAFDGAAGIDATISLSNYSTETISWFQSTRQDASRASENKNALMMRTAEALSNVTGVNVDEEMTLLLDLEHSYEASARLLRSVDDMLNALLSAVR